MRNSTSSCVSPMSGLQISSSVSAGRKASAPKGSEGREDRLWGWSGRAGNFHPTPRPRVLATLPLCGTCKRPSLYSPGPRRACHLLPLDVCTAACSLAPATLKSLHIQVDSRPLLYLGSPHEPDPCRRHCTPPAGATPCGAGRRPRGGAPGAHECGSAGWGQGFASHAPPPGLPEAPPPPAGLPVASVVAAVLGRGACGVASTGRASAAPAPRGTRPPPLRGLRGLRWG